MLEMFKENNMNICDMYDACIVDASTTGVEYPVWILSDDTDQPVIAISNLLNDFSMHDNMCYVDLRDQHIIGSCLISDSQIDKFKKWVLTYKEVLLNHWFNEPFIFDTIKSLHP